ncbi:MLX-interacting protein isoform X2 [Aplysia californica]|uniref:MLX-interacting protein isoform X2 n=1 Tax=Aplysia californica TaxID=6500 RepID=A0ABM0K4P5_APLCA|nr:MLX-interacting protein isoform X2 [Aplysia californica]XP_035828375.1 MLX-interacting protein isoform X2 [Aplysia californica]
MLRRIEPTVRRIELMLRRTEPKLPSLSCDLGDLNISSNEIDQLLRQSFGDASFSLDTHMQFDSEVPDSYGSQSPCDLNFFLEDNSRPRDLNLSFPGEGNVSPLFNTPADAPLPFDTSVTPPHSGGVTPQNMSRSSSPTWSESSGSMSASSSTVASRGTGRSPKSNNPVPRHKRPSHKRAEVKRRDKIKTCLDDLKDHVPSLRDKGKLSESTVLTKAAEYIHQLKDGYKDRGSKAAELRREIECLSSEIHSFQENLPAAGLKEEANSSPSLDDLFQQWASEGNWQNRKFFIFSSLTSKLFETFKEVVGSATTLDSLVSKAQEWQAKYLSLPVLRKQILSGMLNLSRKTSIVSDSESLKLEFQEGNS